jgi:hypothetical protein
MTGIVVEIDRAVATVRTDRGDLVDTEAGALRVGDRVRYHENEDVWRPIKSAVWNQQR